MLRAGAARVCINPADDMFPVPFLMTDFGLEPMQQEEKYDDMNCRAIFVDNGEKKVLFVCYELGGAPVFPGYLKTISDATGVPEDAIYITATHNHTNPRYRANQAETDEQKAWIERYEKILYDAGIEACRKAVETARPAKFAYGEVPSLVNVNRNLKSFCGFWVEARNEAGYCDPTLSIMKFVDEDGKLIAAFLNHATHATCCYMLKDIDHKAKTSGNFTGITCRFVEKYFGEDTVALWTSGAAGDVNPIFSHGLQYEYPDGFTTQVQYPDGTGYMMMEYVGRRHGVDCVRGIESLTEYTDNLPISMISENVNLPGQTCVDGWPPKGMDFSIVRNGGNGPRDYSKNPYGAELVPGLVPTQVPSDKPIVMNYRLMKIGNVAMLFANAEIFSKIGRKMKEASPMKNTVIVTHLYSEGGRVGYLFDEESADILLPMSYGGVIPGTADKILVEAEKELFRKIG